MDAIRQLVLRILTKGKSGIVTTLPKKDLVDFNTMILAEKFMQNGVDPNALKNADQAFNILNQIDEANRVRKSGITKTESAKVFDLEGKEIPKGSKIMGGKAVDEDLPPPGSRGGKDDIAAPVQSREESLRDMTEAEIKREIEAQNKSTLEKMRERKRPDVYTLDDYDTTNMSEIQKQIIRLETRLGNLNPELPGFRERANVLIDEIEKLKGKMKNDPEKKADGGRIGLKEGLGSFTTNDPKEAAKEVIQRLIRIDDAKIPLDEKLSIALQGVDGVQLQGIMEILGGELSFGAGKKGSDKGIGFSFSKKFNEGGRVGLKGGSLKKFLERRNFLKTMVGNSPEAENARILQKILDEQKQFREYLKKNPPVKFPGPGDKEYDDYILRLNEIFAKDRLKSATGGRIGYKVGGIDKVRRAFLKMLGIGAGTTAALKSGILRLADTSIPKEVAKKVPINSSTLSEPPPYFFELADKIKKLGKPDKVTYQDRVEIHRYTGKNGDEYELVEDLTTGDMTITKDKMGVGAYGDKSFDTIQDRSVLEYRAGRMDVKDEGLETQKGFREADEYEEYTVEFDTDGTAAGADDLDEIIQKEIIEEAKGDAPSIKKAGGGIARMLGE